jgi:hypothetical protein
MCLPHVSSIFKKTRPKTSGPHCIYIYISGLQQKMINEYRVPSKENLSQRIWSNMQDRAVAEEI